MKRQGRRLCTPGGSEGWSRCWHSPTDNYADRTCNGTLILGPAQKTMPSNKMKKSKRDSRTTPAFPFPFLQLPLETRIIIYHFVASSGWLTLLKPRLLQPADPPLSNAEIPRVRHCCHTPVARNKPNRNSAPGLSLLRVSRQIRREALQPLAQETLINIDGTSFSHVLRVHDFIPQSFAQHLQHLAIRFPWCHAVEGLSATHLPRLRRLTLFTTESAIRSNVVLPRILGVAIGAELDEQACTIVAAAFELIRPPPGVQGRDFAHGRSVAKILADEERRFEVELHFRVSSRKVCVAKLRRGVEAPVESARMVALGKSGFASYQSVALSAFTLWRADDDDVLL